MTTVIKTNRSKNTGIDTQSGHAIIFATAASPTKSSTVIILVPICNANPIIYLSLQYVFFKNFRNRTFVVCLRRHNISSFLNCWNTIRNTDT